MTDDAKGSMSKEMSSARQKRGASPAQQCFALWRPTAWPFPHLFVRQLPNMNVLDPDSVGSAWSKRTKQVRQARFACSSLWALHEVLQLFSHCRDILLPKEVSLPSHSQSP